MWNHLFKKKTLSVVLLYVVVYASLFIFPTRGDLVDFFGWKVFPYVDTVGLILIIFVNAFFYGWLTVLVLRDITEKTNKFDDSLFKTGYWFPRSLIAVCVWFAGSLAITFLGSKLGPDAVFAFVTTFLGGIWMTLTFTFYPVIITNKSSLLLAPF